MQFIPVLICLTLMSVAQTFPQIYFPRLNLVLPKTEPDTRENPLFKLPSERRQLAIFPRLSTKFVILPEPQHVLPRPIRRPVMKKLVIRNNAYEFENIAAAPMFQNFVSNRKEYERDIDTPQDLEQEKDKEISVEIVAENSEESAESNDIDSKEIEADNAPNEYIKPNDLTLMSTQVVVEEKPLLQVGNENLNDEDNQIADGKEFIFMGPVKQVEKETDVDDVTEDITSAVDPDVPRVKRYDNVIEEENLGTTVAGYKFTWWDTRLTNNVHFNNINS